MIHIAICDDDPIFMELFQSVLEEQLKGEDMEYRISGYSTGEELLKEIANFDAVFLDIDMPGLDGMQIAKYINENHPVPILFLTAYDDLVYSSIQFQPFRFLRKDYIDYELEEAVRSLNKYIILKFQNYSICLHTLTGDILLSIKDIRYAEIYDHLVKIHTLEEVFDCHGKLSEYEEQWKQYGFIRTHKSYLVNGRHIYSIRENTVTLDNGIEISLSRRRKKEVRRKFEFLMRSVE